jgi:hypothetical protein
MSCTTRSILKMRNTSVSPYKRYPQKWRRCEPRWNDGQTSRWGDLFRISGVLKDTHKVWWGINSTDSDCQPFACDSGDWNHHTSQQIVSPVNNTQVRQHEKASILLLSASSLHPLLDPTFDQRFRHLPENVGSAPTMEHHRHDHE